GGPARHLVRVERPDDPPTGAERHRLLPDSGTKARHRVLASAARRRSLESHPHDLPRPDERLRSPPHRPMRGGLTAACGILLAIGAPAFPHRLDEYLQATTISVEKDRVRAEVRLTPGVAVLPVVLARVDRDGDGVLSTVEQRAYAQRVLRDLSLAVDG